jgi:hypothetical protein
MSPKGLIGFDNNILLQKLSEFGVHGLLLKWFSSYLTGRRQLAPYNGFSSGEYSQGSGVPQGSVLGPLLFNVYINDIVTDLEFHALLFADNLKIYRQVSSSEHCVMLQNDLETIDKWCRQNNFSLNIGKCSVVSFSRKTDRTNLTTLAEIRLWHGVRFTSMCSVFRIKVINRLDSFYATAKVSNRLMS